MWHPKTCYFGMLRPSWWGGLVALLNLSSWCLVVVGRLFLAVPRGSLQFVIVVFPDHTHLLFLATRAYFEQTWLRSAR